MTKPIWVPFSPTRLTDKANGDLVEMAVKLKHVRAEADHHQRLLAIERFRHREMESMSARQNRTSARVRAAFHILCDLAKQGWSVRVRKGAIEVGRPSNPLDPEQDRLRIRQQLHAERDEQLREESVRVFIKSMESRRMWNGKMISIFSLIRDGRDLARAIRGIERPVQPYIQFVTGEGKCAHTGLRLVDIWRYFRHTWTTPYKSVPGRTMMMIVRDGGTPFHPVMGIAALSSATVGLTVRDEFIGWTSRQVVERVTADPSLKYGKWMLRITDTAVQDIYVDDLLATGMLTLGDLASPTTPLISRLLNSSREHRKEHHRFMQSGDYKDNTNVETATDEYWEERAKSLLFLSKREQELANLLMIRMALNEYLGAQPTAAGVKAFVNTSEGRLAITKLIRKAKADRVGTVIADLTICGAIPPYNDLLGGKLVAMLITSPEVVNEYRRRYRRLPSIIASSMAGRAVVRPCELVFISTTSLYGRRPNQYDRLVVPAEKIVAGGEGAIRYHHLGKTRGFGSFQFSDDAVENMSMALSQTARGQRVNSVFGEGVNPRLRKIRDGLDELGLPSNILLDHGAPRLVYGVPLIKNLTDYLLGIDAAPQYIMPVKRIEEATSAIGAWWYERWAGGRASNDDVLAKIEVQTLVHPIRHAARVELPSPLSEELTLFET